MRPETEPWWRQAEADLDCAEVLYGAGRYFGSSWFAHQATEKALKALYIEQSGRPANRVHDLNFLGRSVRIPLSMSGDLAMLDSAFALTRYPDARNRTPVDTMTLTIGTRDIESARRVVRWVQSQL